MLDWLSRIPFDEDELSDLRRYFYDADDGGDNINFKGSDGNIHLKHQGDLSPYLWNLRWGKLLLSSCAQSSVSFRRCGF